MVRLTIRVHPRASRNALRFEADGAISAWTTTAPVEGRANDAVCHLLAEALHVPASAVHVLRGAQARTKVVEVEGLSDAAARERLLGSMPSGDADSAS